VTQRLLLVVVGWIALAVTLGGADRTRVEQAIVAAVHARMGEAIDVTLDDLTIDAPDAPTGEVIATLPPDARFGARVRVMLRMPRADGQATRAGAADVVVRATRPTWVASRALARNGEIGAGDADRRAQPLDGLRVQALPADVSGMKVTRDVAPGQILLSHMLQPVPVVRRGDQVTIAVRFGELVASTLGVATSDGRLGDAVKVTTSDSGKAIVAHVIGRGAVEVRHGS
jgi:flagella basal body P-ring formation protein FlgA